MAELVQVFTCSRQEIKCLPKYGRGICLQCWIGRTQISWGAFWLNTAQKNSYIPVIHFILPKHTSISVYKNSEIICNVNFYFNSSFFVVVKPCKVKESLLKICLWHIDSFSISLKGTMKQWAKMHFRLKSELALATNYPTLWMAKMDLVTDNKPRYVIQKNNSYWNVVTTTAYQHTLIESIIHYKSNFNIVNFSKRKWTCEDECMMHVACSLTAYLVTFTPIKD